MKSVQSITAAFVLTSLGAFVGGCASDNHGHVNSNGQPCNDQYCKSAKPGTITSVNSTCVIMPQDPVDPALTAEWNGQKVGFCCKGCISKWNKMNDEQKGAALAKVIAK